MTKMQYPPGVRTWRDGEWQEGYALVEIADEMVPAFEAAGFTVLAPVGITSIRGVISDATMSAPRINAEGN